MLIIIYCSNKEFIRGKFSGFYSGVSFDKKKSPDYMKNTENS